MSPLFDWDEEAGMGVCREAVPHDLYNEDYLDKYVEYDRSEMGMALSAARKGMVERHTRFPVVDIGVGACGFLDAMGEGRHSGYDVNPHTQQRLQTRSQFLDVYQQAARTLPVLTFWDSLEHIEDPCALLSRCYGHVFVSLPIFKNELDCLDSKHFRPGEHIWYWTRLGFVNWMMGQGWTPVEHNLDETELGREAIESFGFAYQGKPSPESSLLKTLFNNRFKLL